MTYRLRRGGLLLLIVALAVGCGSSRAGPGADAGLRPCTDDDQCLPNETCSLGYCQPSGQRDAAPDVAPAALKVTPADIVDFGSPVYGSEIERQVTLENVGGLPVVVNQIDLVENDSVKEFVLDKPLTPFELQPAASQVLTVRLKPADGQLDQGQLIINSTDPAHPTVILQLVTAAKGDVDLQVCVEKTAPTDCQDPPAFPLGQLTYGVPVTRVFHVRATGQGTPVINAQSITLLSSGGMTSTHYQLQLYYRHPNPLDPAQTIEDATALSASDFPKLLSAGDENTAPAEIRGVLVFDALLAGPVPTESVSVQTDAGNVVAPVSGTVSGCPPGFVDLDGNPANGCEYPCTYQGPTDDPDDAFVDANCDGIDGEIGKAIFVAPPPKGDDTNGNGSMDKPYATIAKGIQVAAQRTKTQVFIAAGAYAENLTLVDGISLYGGYDPNSVPPWQRAIGNDTAIMGSARGNADEITVIGANLTKATTLDRLMILSQPAAPGFSSYGVMLLNVAANLVTLSNSELHSGNGGLGTDGTPGTAGQGGQNGSNGGAGLEYACADQSWHPLGCVIYCSAGGNICNAGTPPAGGAAGSSACSRAGGTGASGGLSGAAGTGGSAGVGGAGGGSGGGVQLPGSPGSDGAGGGNGTSGQKGLSFGSAAAGGYVISSGTGGTSGTNGGGGGGGGSGGGDAPWWEDFTTFACCASAGGSGGGGGGGGCGGSAGSYGKGGGGSFGLYLYNASPTFRKCSIYSGSGGAGGRGGEGGAGGLSSTGGAGGPGISNPSDPPEDAGAGGKGGNGGKGGRGGHGGGGGGGPSVGVLKAGAANPSIDAATQMRIYPGTGGLGGSSPDAAASGQAGVSAAVQTI